jgi:hypothetical protein
LSNTVKIDVDEKIEGKIEGLKFVVDGLNYKCLQCETRVTRNEELIADNCRNIDSLKNQMLNIEKNVLELKEVVLGANKKISDVIDDSSREVSRKAGQIIKWIIAALSGSTIAIIIFVSSCVNNTFNNLDNKILCNYKSLDDKINLNNNLFLQHIQAGLSKKD